MSMGPSVALESICALKVVLLAGLSLISASGPKLCGIHNVPYSFVKNTYQWIPDRLALGQWVCNHIAIIHPHNCGDES